MGEVPIIRLAPADVLPSAAVRQLRGQMLDERHYVRLIRESACVLKPDGTPLLIYHSQAIPMGLCCRVLWTIAGQNLRPSSGLRSQMYAGRRPKTVASAPMGYLDDRGDLPCRLTAWTTENLSAFRALLPLVNVVNQRYRQLAPEHWASQHQFVSRVPKDYRLGDDSVFTTITINRSWPTPVHVDDGDYREGLGVLSVLQDGDYEGCELVFPQYRVAVDLRMGGVLLADVHAWHGNTPFRTLNGTRYSLVYYARERIDECRSLEVERAWAQRRER